jgi:hypothetical protein
VVFAAMLRGIAHAARAPGPSRPRLDQRVASGQIVRMIARLESALRRAPWRGLVHGGYR